MKAVLLTLAAVALAAALVAAALVGGLYDISATDQHLRPTYWAIDTASRRSVKLRSSATTACNAMAPPAWPPIPSPSA